MHSLQIIAIALGMSLGTSVTLAQDAPAKKPEAKAPVKKAVKPDPTFIDKSTIGTGRDWAKIDTNGDHSISPEEMEIWLKANPATPAK